jgi:hypothetical protein
LRRRRGCTAETGNGNAATVDTRVVVAGRKASSTCAIGRIDVEVKCRDEQAGARIAFVRDLPHSFDAGHNDAVSIVRQMLGVRVPILSSIIPCGRDDNRAEPASTLLCGRLDVVVYVPCDLSAAPLEITKAKTLVHDIEVLPGKCAS